MEQRRHRLGDTVDDYCPRERRLTDHAIVAMIEDEIRLTRCTACDAEHPYRGGRVPKRRKKDEALYDEVLAGRLEGRVRPGEAMAGALDDAEPPAEDQAAEEGVEVVASSELDETLAETAASSTGGEDSVRRPLIRATLPRPEGQPAARPLPEFTARQAGARGFRSDGRGNPRLWPSTNGGRPTPHGGTARHGRSGRPGQGFDGRASHSQSSGQRHDRAPRHARHSRPTEAARTRKKRSR